MADLGKKNRDYLDKQCYSKESILYTPYRTLIKAPDTQRNTHRDKN